MSNAGLSVWGSEPRRALLSGDAHLCVCCLMSWSILLPGVLNTCSTCVGPSSFDFCRFVALALPARDFAPQYSLTFRRSISCLGLMSGAPAAWSEGTQHGPTAFHIRSSLLRGTPRS